VKHVGNYIGTAQQRTRRVNDVSHSALRSFDLKQQEEEILLHKLLSIEKAHHKYSLMSAGKSML
jgi:hypothetical protein